jgi:hypothetical protein
MANEVDSERANRVTSFPPINHLHGLLKMEECMAQWLFELGCGFTHAHGR